MSLVRVFSILIVLMIAFSIFLFSSTAQNSNVLNAEQVKKLSLENAIQTLPNYQFTVLSTEKKEGDAWKIIIKAVKKDSTCPTVLIREYNSPPFDNFRDEKRIVNCRVEGNLVFEEEAIISSQTDSDVKALIKQDGSAIVSQAAKISPSTFKTLALCNSCFYYPLLSDLVSSGFDFETKSVFIIEWKASTKTILIALDEKGIVLSKSIVQ